MQHPSWLSVLGLTTIVLVGTAPRGSAQEKVVPVDVDAAVAKVRQGFDPDGPRASPFVAMRAAGAELEVRLAGDPAWYRWESLDGYRASDLRAVCEGAFEERWWKRITEDLPAVLMLLGHDGDMEVDLTVFDAEAERSVVHRDVAMTLENRQQLLRANSGDRSAVRPAVAARLPRADWRADLETLRGLLANSFSYAPMRGIDPAAVLEGEFARLEEVAEEGELSRAQFARAVQQIITPFGDGHAGVRSLGEHLDTGSWLPFLVEQAEGDRFVAVRSDRGGFVDPAHPYVVALDGRGLEDWLELSSELNTVGSPQLVRRRAVRGLRALPLLREMGGHAASPQVVVTLAAADGATVKRQIALAGGRSRPNYGTWPRVGERFRVVDGRIGVLRLDQMSGEPWYLAEIEAGMRRAAEETRGLVLDLRGNGGGTRDALRQILPWLMTDAEPAVVVNVAAARLGAIPEGERGPRMLGNRFLYPADWSGWSAAARSAVRKAAAGFEPSWRLPGDGYSPWHFFVVEREVGHPRYAHPVVVLMDHDCFSATDIFLGAMKGRPGVTLVGTASSGGSARSRSYTLPRSGLRIRLGSIASFRPDGSAYDGIGIEPDVEVWPAPEDFVSSSDLQLDRALALLR